MVQLVVDDRVIATLEENAAELLFGGGPQVAQDGEVGLLQRAVQLLQAVWRRATITLLSRCTSHTHQRVWLHTVHRHECPGHDAYPGFDHI